MPKSGFDPQRHQRKHNRHNPLGSGGKKANQSASASSSTASSSFQAIKEQAGKASANGSASASDQIVPLLQNLPLPSTPADQQAAIQAGDKIWSLASVSLLLSTQSGHTLAEIKQNRKLLLSKDIIARLILALQSDTNVEVRREASGALRNLCVDAGFDVRAEVANKGGVDAVLGSMRWAANALGFEVDGTSSTKAPAAGSSAMFVDDTPTAAEEVEKKRALLAKPIDQMNKKEKRHATRLAAAMGKSLEQVAGQTLTPEDEDVLSGATGAADASAQASGSSAAAKSEPFISLDSDTRKGLLEMSENLATVVWCLCECGGNPFAKLITWRWLDEDLVGPSAAAAEIAGQGLAAWLCGSIALGCRAASVLSATAADGTKQGNNGDAISALKNEELSLVLDLALASANALCGLTDGGEADFVDGLLGRPSSSSGGSGGASGKKKVVKSILKTVHLPAVESLEQQAEGATKRLAQMDQAIALLEACVQTDASGLDKLKRYILSQTTMLGVLVSGALRNVAAAVDRTKASGTAASTVKKKKQTAFTSSNIFVPPRAGGAQALTLRNYEESHVLPALMQLLASVDCTALARDLQGQAIVEPEADASAEELQAKQQTRAEEKAQTLSLAIEVLAEMASGFDQTKGGESDEWQEDLEAEESGDDEMEDDDAEIADDVPFDEDGDEDAAEDKGAEDDKMGDDDTFAEAVKRGGGIRFEQIAPTLSRLVLPLGGGPALADVLLPLARPFESSFPSLAGADAVQGAAVQKQAPTLLRAIHLRSLSVLNNVLLRLASYSAPPPSQPISDPKDARRLAAFRTWLSDASGAGARLTATFQALYEVARGCASVPAVATAAPVLSNTSNGSATQASTAASAPGSGKTEQQDGLLMVETCIGSLWSIARCLEGFVPLAWSNGTVLPSSAGAHEAELISALIASYHTATSDSMKVKSISLLSTIARAPQVTLELNERIATFLLAILEEIPDRPSPSAGAGKAESVVAAINGLIDTFADENAHYDVVFRKGDMLKRSRATVFKCRAVVKSIDRRKYLSLRAIAEEAAENWMAFVEYRQSLKL
ncbi:hypothetical protein ACQY0O_008313 [Thecaphora frezii]